MNQNIFKVEYYGKEVQFFLPNKGDHIQNVIKNSGSFYEIEMLQDILKIVSPDGIAIDVGANIGNHTIFFSAICGLRTYSFEPAMTTRETLTKNIDINNLNKMVVIQPYALGQREGTAGISFPSVDNIGMARVVSEMADCEKIQVRTLDSFEISDIRLLKIDVEGMELDVLKGARETINKNKPIILAELQTVNEYNSVRKYLQKLSYIPVERYNATPTIMFWHKDDVNLYLPFFLSKRTV